MKATEQRWRPFDLEMRGKPGEGAVLSGYVAVFDQPSEVLWDFRSGHFVERVDASAFNRTIGLADIKALRNHDPNYIVGRSKAGVGNIRFAPDETGLYHELDVPDTATARSLYEDVEQGFIDQMSFAFRTLQDEWTDGEETPERRLLEVALEDISYVAYPAYPQTSADARVALRSYARHVGVADLEELEVSDESTVTTQDSEPPQVEDAATTPDPEPPEPESPRKFHVIEGV